MSAFGDAITQAMVSSLDPMNLVSRNMADAMIRAKNSEVVETKASAGLGITQQLAAARASQAEPAIIEFYEKLLAELNAL